jgi:hypothetical protein
VLATFITALNNGMCNTSVLGANVVGRWCNLKAVLTLESRVDT